MHPEPLPQRLRVSAVQCEYLQVAGLRDAPGPMRLCIGSAHRK